MIKFVKGDFFDHEADIRINTVNCVGVMGAGVALTFKNKYPKMFKDYKKACSKGEVEPGKPHVWKNDDFFSNVEIINFPTKKHWRNPSKYEYIEKGLTWLKKYLSQRGNVTLTLPALGCGHGGLDWEIVQSMIQKHLGDLDANILVFEPKASTNKQITADLQKRLDDEGIETLSPGSKDYPPLLKGKSALDIYCKGNVDLLKGKNISIVVTSKPDEREKNAMSAFIKELKGKDITFALGYGSSFEVDVLKEVLENGFKAIVTLPFGILQLKIRKDLLDYWDYKNLLVTSSIHPNKEWKSYEIIRSLKFRLKISDVVLISSLKYERFKKVEKDFKTQNNNFYLNYWESKVDFFQRISAKKVGLHPTTKRPNTSKIIHSLGAVTA